MPAALLLLLCAACNDSSKKSAADNVGRASANPSNKMESAVTADSAGTALYNEDQQAPIGTLNGKQKGPIPAPPAAVHPDWDKKIIKTADLSIEVKNFRHFSDHLRAAVKGSDAYIAQEQQTQSAGEIENTITVKVPVGRFDDFLVQLPSDSDRLLEKKVTSEDVTTQLVDTKSRLETKKEVRERYLELLREAHGMNDIITVQNEINDIQEQMDQAAGRIAWLGHSAAYSTINLHFFQVLDAGAVANPSPSFIHQLKEALGEGWDWLSRVLLQLISVWPLWIALVLGVGWARKWMRGWRVNTDAGAVPKEAAGGDPQA